MARRFIHLLLPLFLFVYAYGCSDQGLAPSGGEVTSTDNTNDGYGSSDGEDSSGAGGSSGSSSGSLFEGGPISIPVPVARLEAPDPTRIVLSIGDTKVSIAGLSGAITDPTASPLIWVWDDELAIQQTGAVRSDGSFTTITFTYSQASDARSLAVAGYDGTTVGTPIFLKISSDDNNNITYLWRLTNGATVVQSAVSMENNTVFVVSELTDPSTSVNTQLRRATSTQTTSYLYALNVGGVAQTIASGPIKIDQILVDESQIMVRSGTSFYYPNASKGFSFCCDVDSAEEINHVTSGLDDNAYQVLGVATDRAYYLCSKRTATCDEIHTLGSNEEYISSLFLQNSQTSQQLIFVHYSQKNGSVFNARGVIFDTSGNPVDSVGLAALPVVDDFLGASYQDINNSRAGIKGDTISIINLYKMDYTEGGSGNDFSFSYPTPTYVPSTSTQTPGSETISILTAQSSINNVLGDGDDILYPLDSLFTFRQNSDGGDPLTLLSVTPYREIYGVEVHPSGRLLLFCSKDSSGHGQIHAYCPSLVDTSSTEFPGEEIIQLTFGDETCTPFKNWKIDIESPDNTWAAAVIDLSDPPLPQIRFIDIFNQPELAGCFE